MTMTPVNEPTPARAPEPRPAQFFVERLTLRNFKGIENLEITLEPGLTLLVGRNNAGKSRILRALQIAVGGAPAERDDLTVGPNGPAQIDVILAPLPPQTPPADLEERDAEDDSPATDERFAPELQTLFTPIAFVSDRPVRQRFGLRTRIDRASEGSGARSQSRIIGYDIPKNEWEENEDLFVSHEVRRLLHAELIDTRRDIDQELRQRGSAVRRILNELRIEDSDRDGLEENLAALGENLLRHSTTLTSLRDSLNQLERYLDSVGSARVDPVPRTLEELARVVGVSFDDGTNRLASRLHGAGVRSLASLLVQDVFCRKILGRDGGDLLPRSLTLVEEPEAHLHPHAIWEVANLLNNGTSQVVATTHSSQLATSVRSDALRLLRNSPTRGHLVVDFGPSHDGEEEQRRTKQPRHYPVEVEKLKQLLDQRFSDLLFASAIVIGEGATERAFLPPVLRGSLGPLAHGISVIDSKGMQNELVSRVIKFCCHAEVPFVVFADADRAGGTKVKALADDGLITVSKDVIWVTASGEDPSISRKPSRTAFERMMIDFDINVCRDACRELGNEPEDNQQVLGTMKKLKGSIGTVLAQEFLAAWPFAEGSPWPMPLCSLTKRLVEKLGPAAGNGGATK